MGIIKFCNMISRIIRWNCPITNDKIVIIIVQYSFHIFSLSGPFGVFFIFYAIGFSLCTSKNSYI